MLTKQYSVEQEDFGAVIHTPMERLLILDQRRYHKPINITKQFFDFYMQLRIQGPVLIRPNYPNGWFADVLSEDKVWTVECYKGALRLIRVGDLVGYTDNGGYIVTAEEDLSHNMYYHSCRQGCEYAGAVDEPPQCRDFCDNGDWGEFRCECCPWLINK